MHTVKVIAAGFALLGVLLLIAMKLFIPLWFAVSVINLIVGITRAGYSFLQEAPILLVVFGVPALAASLIWWRFGRKVA
jgi:hypothetical protein